MPGLPAGSGDRGPQGGPRDQPTCLPRRGAEAPSGRLEPGAHDCCAEVVLPLPRRGRAARPRPGAAATDAQEAGGAPGRADDGRARAAARPTRTERALGAPLPRQTGARPTAARADGVRGPAPERAARARLGRHRPLAPSPARAEGEGRPAADDPDPSRARAALRRVLRDARTADRPGGLRRRAGQPAPLHPARPDVPTLRRRGRRQRAQAGHPAHAPARLRVGAPARRREPAPDPGAPRSQAPRLDAALHARQRPRAARRDQAAPLGRLISPLLAACRLESSELVCQSAAMAKRKPKARVPATKSAPVVPLPDRRSMESALAAIGRGAAHYASDEALFQAQDLMYEAFEAQGGRRVALAREALEISPDCADAYLLLAEETASSVEEARELLEQGVAAGERALGPEPFDEDVGHFWGILETRPYMRARAALAETLWALDLREEAVEHQRELLRLNPNDNQGLRYRQAEWLLWLEHYEELDEVFAAYEDDAAAALVYTKALAAFRRQGESAATRRLLEEARKLNPHVPAYLSGRKRLPKRLPDYVGFGDDSEAVDYAAGAAALWASVPGALTWLDS